MSPLSFLTNRWRFYLSVGSELQYRLMAWETNAISMMISTRPFLSLVPARWHRESPTRPCIHPRWSRDLIPETHLLDWGRTNFSISRQLRGYERIEWLPLNDVHRNFSSNRVANSVITIKKCLTWCLEKYTLFLSVIFCYYSFQDVLNGVKWE